MLAKQSNIMHNHYKKKQESVYCTVHDQNGAIDDKIYKGEKRSDKKIKEESQFCDCVYRVH